jgi:putative PEP-CTERM system histidine kinase
LIINIATLSYGFGAVAYLVLAILLGTAWRGRLQGALLLSATTVSVFWCAANALYASTGTPELLWLSALETVRDVLWLAFLLRLLGFSEGGRRELKWLAIGAWAVPLMLLIWLAVSRFAPAGLIGATAFIGGTAFGLLVLSVLGLALVEQLYRNTKREHRWGIKLLCMGIGGLCAYDLFLYSNAMIVRQIDGEIWAARGAVNAMVVPLLAVSAVRNPDWSLEIFVSRHVVFHSATLLGTGVYLTLMAGVGYYIRLYGGEWGSVVQTVFFFGALVLLVAMLASGQIRARLRVLLNKHFFRNKYEYREEWLRFTHTLSNSEDDAELRLNIICGFASVVESLGGVLWVRKTGGHFIPVSSHVLILPQGCTLGESHPLSRFLTSTGWVVFVDEISTRPDRYEGLVLPDWFDTVLRPWLIVPLLHGDSLEGFVVLSRSDTVRHLNWEDSDLLKTMGRQGATHLAMMRASEALSEARQFEAFNRLSSYVVHDLKNVAAQLGLVTANARKHLSNPEFVADAMGTVENATSKMNRMLAQLRKGRLEETSTKLVNVSAVLGKVVAARSADQPVPTLDSRERGLVVSTDPERLATIIEHMVQNAQEATPSDGSVTIVARSDDDGVIIEVVDTGSGMDANFIAERLFKPFDTTKGNAGMGIGVYESREFVHSSGGYMEVISAPGAGTTFLIKFPTAVALVDRILAPAHMEN